jgi:RNA polymerase sigma factor (TIGR02999 family)
MDSLTKQQLDALGELEGGIDARVLVVQVYDELRALAAAYLRSPGPDSTLQPTALVHEAYLRLADKDDAFWKDRTHFKAVAARAMRYALINHLRDGNAQKRGGADARRVTLSAVAMDREGDPIDVVALSDLIDQLAVRSARQARIVDLRVFGGMTIEETAAALDVSPATIKADWTIARAWLAAQL